MTVRQGQCNPRAGSLSILSRALSPRPSLHPLWQTPAPLGSCSSRLLPLPTQAQPPQGLVPALGSTTIYLAQSRIRRDTLLQRQGEQAPVRTRGGDLLGVLLAFPACISFREKGFWLSLAAPQHKCFAHQ